MDNQCQQTGESRAGCYLCRISMQRTCQFCGNLHLNLSCYSRINFWLFQLFLVNWTFSIFHHITTSRLTQVSIVSLFRFVLDVSKYLVTIYILFWRSFHWHSVHVECGQHWGNWQNYCRLYGRFYQKISDRKDSRNFTQPWRT